MSRLQGKEVNRLIDQALIEPNERAFIAVAAIAISSETVKLAERVRRRAFLKAREVPETGRQILRVRDRLILFIYGRGVPGEGFSGWCDASLKRGKKGTVAAIGGLLLSPQGRLVGWITEPTIETETVKAEATAVAVLMREALRLDVERLRVHNDCAALVQLWLERREDPRLNTIRKLAGRFRWFELHKIPRLHNQPADRLAKKTMVKLFTDQTQPRTR